MCIQDATVYNLQCYSALPNIKKLRGKRVHLHALRCLALIRIRLYARSYDSRPSFRIHFMLFHFGYCIRLAFNRHSVCSTWWQLATVNCMYSSKILRIPLGLTRRRTLADRRRNFSKYVPVLSLALYRKQTEYNGKNVTKLEYITIIIIN